MNGSALFVDGEIMLECGTDRFRVVAQGASITLHAPSVEALRRAFDDVQSRAAVDAAEVALRRAELTVSVAVDGETLFDFPGPANLGARALGLTAGRLRLWPAARAWLRQKR